MAFSKGQNAYQGQAISILADSCTTLKARLRGLGNPESYWIIMGNTSTSSHGQLSSLVPKVSASQGRRGQGLASHCAVILAC